MALACYIHRIGREGGMEHKRQDGHHVGHLVVSELT
jgi:hypothetical protein